MMQKFKILVTGRVQGVYFRMFTQNKAKHFGIKGSVCNLPDGRVEIIAEAEQAIMEKFIKWCHKGPITARVDHVELIELPVEEPLTTFVIKQ
jgi:acylphosphatase